MKRIIFVLTSLLIVSVGCRHKQKAKEYFQSGSDKEFHKNFKAAIADYNKAIEFSPNWLSAYESRGNCKNNLDDYRGAILDYDRVIELGSHMAFDYLTRGECKENIGEFWGAIIDYTKMLELSYSYASGTHLV